MIAKQEWKQKNIPWKTYSTNQNSGPFSFLQVKVHLLKYVWTPLQLRMAWVLIYKYDQ